MSILAKFTKQPADVQDYDIDFAEEYLAGFGDSAASFTVTVEDGITLVSSSMSAGVVKVFLSGGTTGQKYKVTARVTTAAGRTKEAEIVVSVKET